VLGLAGRGQALDLLRHAGRGGGEGQAGGLGPRLPTFTDTIRPPALADASAGGARGEGPSGALTGDGGARLERPAGGDPELQRLMQPIRDRQERDGRLQALQQALGARIHALETQSAAARTAHDELSTAASPPQRSSPATWRGGLVPPRLLATPPSRAPLHLLCIT
jgi:hypothetical protein